MQKLSKFELTLAHIGTQALNSNSTAEKILDFDANVKEIHVFFPSGQNGKLQIEIEIARKNILTNFDKTASPKRYLAGDNSTMFLRPNFPIRRTMSITIKTTNTDLVFNHDYFIWITVQKKEII